MDLNDNDNFLIRLDVNYIDENVNVFNHFASGSHAMLNPIVIMVGGIVGKVIVKPCSSKFHPLFQFFYFDSLEYIPVEPLGTEDVRPMNFHYNAQIYVFGNEKHKSWKMQNYFLWGMILWDVRF
jgi:ubiquitin-activating enzyme E1